MPTTLGTLRTEAQGRADMESDGNVSTAAWAAFINAARRRLRRILVQANPQLFVSSKTFTLAANTYQYDLLANTPTFWKALALDWVTGSQADQILKVPRFMWGERSLAIERSYRIYGNTLEIRPAAVAPGNYALWYVTQPAVLAADGDQLDLVEDMWSEFIELEAAIKARRRQRRDTNDLAMELKDIVAEMRIGAADNDVGEPDRVLDVQTMNRQWVPRLPPP